MLDSTAAVSALREPAGKWAGGRAERGRGEGSVRGEGELEGALVCAGTLPGEQRPPKSDGGGSHVSDTQPDTHPPVAIRREKCHGAQDTLHFRDKKTWGEAEVFLEASAALYSQPLSLRAAIFPIPQDRQKQRATVWPPMRPQPG